MVTVGDDKELLKNIINSSMDGILAFDRECRYTVWNPGMEHISGLRADQVVGRVAFDLFPFLVEIGEDRYFHEALAGRYAVARDRPFVIAATGREGFFEGHYTPLLNANRDVVGGLGIIRDITEIKETQSQLLQAGRLAAMGQLGAGIAHELNQPLSAIRMLVGMMQRQPEQPIGKFEEDLELISQQVARMAGIVDNVRGFARKSNFRSRPTDALCAINDALMLMSERFRLADVELVKQFDPDLPAIRADVLQLQQVFLNLLTNALQALELHEGRKRLVIGARPSEAGVEFWIEDSGPGVPEALRRRIFDPFFTTKEPGDGTGLGLSLCYGIVQKHGGTITVDRGDEGGARFVVVIPTTGEQPVQVECPHITARRKHAARVLAVDDEEILRLVLGRALDYLGYAHLMLGCGNEALARVDAEHFDVALIDLKMPRVDGFAVCSRIRESHPELPVIAMSGFVTEDDRATLRELGVTEFLAKPFDSEILADLLERTLQGSLSCR